MYHMLIVDDEPVIVEGLYDLFLNLNRWPLEVYLAYGGEEALERCRRTRIDIVLTDIEMPEMNGIELQLEINKLWPKCKVIFLTGYNHFSYIQASMRNGGVDYVLKAEGDKQIIQTVEKAVHQLSEEYTYDGLVSRARSQMTLAIPSLRREYLLELLDGERSTNEARARKFRELAIPLQPDRPVYMAAGRVDVWKDDTSATDKSLFLYAINNIFEEYFSDDFQTVHLIYTKDRFLWLLQPKASSGLSEPSSSSGDVSRYLMGMLESIQASCKQHLKLSCSLVVSGEPSEWDQLPDKFNNLSILFVQGLGIGQEVLLSDQHLFEGEQQDRVKLNRVHLLDQYLDQRDQDKFNELFEEIVGTIREPSTIHTGIALEIFYSLSVVFITYINKRSLLQELSAGMDMKKLFSIYEHGSWMDAAQFFRKIADTLFERKIKENEYETSKVVRTINEYVEANLSGDLTLCQLSEIVYLTPFYLSRLYKQKTGVSIKDYITDMKIAKAKQLLSQSQLKIHEVGIMIGYDSPPYFTRFFKKATQLTPQEYRDSTNQ